MFTFCPFAVEWGSVADWVGGLLTGGGILAAVALAGRPERDERRRRVEHSRGQAQYISFKLRAMFDAVDRVATHFATPVPADWPRDAKPESWRWIKHPLGLLEDGRIRITDEEVGLFLNGGQFKLAEDLSLFSRRYGMLFELVSEYRIARHRIERMPVSGEAAEGSRLKSLVEWKDSPLAIALSAAVQQQVSGVLEVSSILLESCSKIASGYTAAARLALNDPSFTVIGRS